MANVDNSYNYRKAVLQKLAEPSSVAATPDIGDVTLARAATMGKTAVQDAALAKDVAFAEKSLAVKEGQFTAKLALDREMLDTWEQQNKWATAIALGNLGIQGLSYPAAKRSLAKREATQGEIMALEKKKVSLAEAANQQMADQNQIVTDIRNLYRQDATIDRRGY